MSTTSKIKLSSIKSTLLFLCFILPLISTAQIKQNESILFGPGVFYNFQTEGVSIDFRARVPVKSGKLYVVPHFTYFPTFNNINEYYLGIDANYNILRYRRIRGYLLTGAYYDNWLNYYNYSNNKVKQNNFVIQGGGGLIFERGCLNPFIEYRYDTKWKEGLLGAGILISLRTCKANKRRVRCPAYY